MTSEPLVSVLMPVYNEESYVSEAIESVQNQSYSNWELIVVDDASTDNTYEMVRQYADGDNRIQLLRNKVNKGIVETRNRLLEEIDDETRYIALCDGDDVMLPERLQTQARYLDANEDIVLVGSDVILIDDDSEQVGVRRYPKSYESICEQMLIRNPIAQPTVMVRACLDLAYDPGYEVAEDYALWLEIASKHRIANLKPLTKYRVHSDQTMNDLSKHIRATKRIQDRWLGHPAFSTTKAYLTNSVLTVLSWFPDPVLNHPFVRQAKNWMIS
jgi:glycosyltransferase involved in cell wall biosynthesis